jgi:hypothetical protein
MAEHITYVPLPSDHRSDSTDNEGVVHNLVQLAKTQVETIKTQVETIKTQVVDWLNAHPTVKETLVAGGDILSTVLLFADLASDSILTADLFRADELLFGSMSVFLIINQFVAMDKAVHAFATRKASGGAQLAHLLAGFPFAPIFLDLALALNALRLLPADPRWDELIAQYKSTRSLLEVTLESAPQTLLQGVLFARFLLSDADGAGFQVPLQMLLISFTLSTINLLKAWIGAWFAARALELVSERRGRTRTFATFHADTARSISDTARRAPPRPWLLLLPSLFLGALLTARACVCARVCARRRRACPSTSTCCSRWARVCRSSSFVRTLWTTASSTRCRSTRAA